MYKYIYFVVNPGPDLYRITVLYHDLLPSVKGVSYRDRETGRWLWYVTVIRHKSKFGLSRYSIPFTSDMWSWYDTVIRYDPKDPALGFSRIAANGNPEVEASTRDDD